MNTARNLVWRRSCQLALAAALGVVSTGCIIIPTPEFNSGNARANITKQTAGQFEPGRTTRADVILALGEPDAVSPDEQSVAYRSEKICGFWFVGGYGSAAGGSIPKDRYLAFHFDSQGRLIEAERSARWLGSSVTENILHTSGTNAPAILEEPVHLQYPSQWYPQQNGFRDKHWEQQLGLAGQLLLTSSNLLFKTQAQFANTPPELSLSYSSLVECRVDDYFLGRRLVVRTHAGEYQTFMLCKRIGGRLDKPATTAACDFLNARIRGEAGK